MEVNQFINNFKDIFDDEPTQPITVDTVFRDIEGWSSLAALSFIAMADEEYGVTIKGNDIQNSKTVGDFFNIVASRV